MLPIPATFYCAHRRAIDIKLRGDRLLCAYQTSDIEHLLGCQACRSVALSPCLPTLDDLVGDIIGVRSQKQMVRVTAEWIIATM